MENNNFNISGNFNISWNTQSRFSFLDGISTTISKLFQKTEAQITYSFGNNTAINDIKFHVERDPIKCWDRGWKEINLILDGSITTCKINLKRAREDLINSEIPQDMVDECIDSLIDQNKRANLLEIKVQSMIRKNLMRSNTTRWTKDVVVVEEDDVESSLVKFILEKFKKNEIDFQYLEKVIGRINLTNAKKNLRKEFENAQFMTLLDEVIPFTITHKGCRDNIVNIYKKNTKDRNLNITSQNDIIVEIDKAKKIYGREIKIVKGILQNFQPKSKRGRRQVQENLPLVSVFQNDKSGRKLISTILKLTTADDLLYDLLSWEIYPTDSKYSIQGNLVIFEAKEDGA